MQDQYALIHDAVLESMICGETQIQPHDLHQATKRLGMTDQHQSEKSGLDKQFEVCIPLELLIDTSTSINAVYIVLNKQYELYHNRSYDWRSNVCTHEPCYSNCNIVKLQ